MIALEWQYKGQNKKIRADRETVTVGRDASCQIRLPEDGIADRHCTLRLEQTKRSGSRGKKNVLVLEDHQCSDVPTLVNGFEVIKTQLKAGDQIVIGPLTLVVLDRHGGVGTSAPPSIGAAPAPERAPTHRPAAAASSPVSPAPAPPRSTPDSIDGYDDIDVPDHRAGTTRSGPAVRRSQRSPVTWLVTGVLAAGVVLAILLVVKQGTEPEPERRRNARRDSTGALAKALEGGRGATGDARTAGTGATPAGRSNAGTGTAPSSTDPGQTSGGAGTPAADAGANAKKRGTDGANSGSRAGSGSKTAPPAKDLLTKREIYLEALKADKLSQEHDFEGAGERYATLARSTTQTRLQDEMKDRLVDLRRLARAREHIEARVAAAKRDDAEMPAIANRGGTARVRDIEDRTLVVELAGGRAKLPWNKVSPKAMTQLLRWAHAEAEGELLRGLYLFEWKDRFAADRNLERRCHAAIHKALQLAPSKKDEANAILRRALGVSSQTGFVYHGGRFMTAERRERLGDVTASREQLANLESARPETRQAAYAYLHAVKDLEVYQMFRRVLEARRLAIGRELLASSLGQKLTALRTEKEKFLALRKKALDRIFDTKAYPYPYRVGRGATQEDHQNYVESQRIIDGYLKTMRKAWEGTRGSFKLGPAFVRRYQELREVIVELAKFPKDEVPPAEAIAPLTALGDPSFFASRHGNKITLATLPMDPAERHRMEYGARVMDYNRDLQCDATKTERKQVLVTNEYRLMMGRRAIMLNPNLLAAARGHSRDMVLKGYFAHEAPDPERRTYQMRVALAGYKGSASENICRGTSSPVKAHDRWIHSSGHHRNILRAHWYELGSGNVGSFWTQNFGSRGKSLDQLQAEQKASAQR